ncbi:MAG: hypothetical protein SVQ76_02450 [Candidatus Nanohaloarchaea archaeon]|nr:hypothetical protein [Candidatus Nanohaloarchaea archaeon]
MRITSPQGTAPAPVEVKVEDYGELVERAEESVESFSEEGYAGEDSEVADDVVSDESPVYSVDVLLPEQRVPNTLLEREALVSEDTPLDWVDYVGSAVDDPWISPSGIVEALERGDELELRAVAYAREEGTNPEYRVDMQPLPVELPNREENLEALRKVEDAVEDSMQEKRWYESFVHIGGFGTPEEALRMLDGSEIKVAAVMDIDVEPSRFVEVGYFTTPENDGTEFGIEVRKSGEEQIVNGPGGMIEDEEVRSMVSDLERSLRDRGVELE